MHHLPAPFLPTTRRAAVLGAGIVGLTTAWQLQRDGFEVTVIDRAAPGRGASAANGAQLSYAYVQPLADPSIWRQLPRLLLAADSPFSLRLRADPAQWAWGLRFLAACRAGVSAQTTAQLLALAEDSRTALQALLADVQPACHFSATGKLVMYADEASFAAARRQLALQRALGSAAQQALTTAECLRIEPALAASAGGYVGGIHTPGECAADCAALCDALHAALAARGVRFVLGAPIERLVHARGRVHAAQVGGQAIEADVFVAALGTGVAALGRSLGLRVPVYPLKGYSLTVAARTGGALAPHVSVTDAKRKIVFARLGNRLRVAGMAELAGEDTRVDPRRVAQLRAAAQAVFPQASDYADPAAWAGLRPATPTGRPILGALPGAPANLLFNAGHGALGFTLAAGSALRLSRLLQQAPGPRLTPRPARPAACSA